MMNALYLPVTMLKIEEAGCGPMGKLDKLHDFSANLKLI